MMRGALLLLITLSVPPVAEAATVRHWTPGSAEELSLGTLDGVAVDRTGHVRLAPALATLWGPETGVVWSLAPFGAAGAGAGLSGPARVLRLSAGEAPETWFEAKDEVLVTALVADAKAVTYAVSPSGRVLRQTRRDDPRPLFETGSLFVWALSARPDGTVWAGTGAPGRVLRWRAKTGVETVFESGDDPVRCLAALPDGSMLAGTGMRGRVIRIARDGKPFVLLDADEEEIVGLVVASDGAIFALAAGEPKPRTPARRRAAARQPVGDSVTVKAAAPGGDEPEQGKPEQDDLSAEAAQALTQAKQPPPRGGGALYRIDPDGTTFRIWTPAEDTPLSLAATAAGRLLVGTAGAGRIWEVERDGEAFEVLRVPSEQVSVLAPGPAGRILVGGAADARVGWLGPGPAEAGQWLSEPIDAEGVADWGRVRWDGDVPPGAALSVAARSGNTDEPDETWSEWSPLEGQRPDRGVAANVPAARWLQVRVGLRRSADGRSPVLRRIEAAYRTRNHPPEIRRLTVEPYGIAWLRVPSPSQGARGPLVADDPVSRKVLEQLNGGRIRPAPIRKYYEPGARTFSWEAEDADGDALSFTLEIRRDSETEWFPLARGIEEDFFSWDSRAMPDGAYRVRLRGEDAAGNPDGRSFTATRVSEPFRVDHTPPRLVDLSVRSRGRTYEVEFTALDPDGRVEAVEYALDGRTWRSVDPLDGVADSEEERYRVEIPLDGVPEAGGHLVLRVTDAFGNLGGEMRRLQSR